MPTPHLSKIATVEVPVSRLERSIKWYTEILGLHVHFRGEHDAMLTFGEKGSATVFLVETNDEVRLAFMNSNTGVRHSVIDFYTSELKAFYAYLQERNVKVGRYNVNPDDPNGLGGFGFEDPDGNWLSACNIDHDQFMDEDVDAQKRQPAKQDK